MSPPLGDSTPEQRARGGQSNRSLTDDQVLAIRARFAALRSETDRSNNEIYRQLIAEFQLPLSLYQMRAVCKRLAYKHLP